ncbi:CCCH zinc finger protein [Volvox carteri f. nagariensis]|uniref:CCCH zinc finger protein n=1 Tax=Volvox carteri f. nagariensis TaxID=3068 RepID=D8UKG8_VOLCA|nr:CCCH zinc finger protein [Volvox carteri f. nagariensis]EFJ39773.1 CCCH zinc finger protein [Volvox carteri f. nagariensis]|eukprot:XP_002959150.1 CCCH zinc finger protein [Volvox carteri f. nagariensis]
MKKTRICEEFVRTGSCKYGDKCTFAHGWGSKEGSKEGSLHKTRLCERFMNTKSCPYGDKCTFAHG